MSRTQGIGSNVMTTIATPVPLNFNYVAFGDYTSSTRGKTHKKLMLEEPDNSYSSGSALLPKGGRTKMSSKSKLPSLMKGVVKKPRKRLVKR